MGKVVLLEMARETTWRACPKTDGLHVTFI